MFSKKSFLFFIDFFNIYFQNENKEVEEALRFTMDVVGGKFTAAKKDNDFVYHEKEPEFDSLDVVKGNFINLPEL